jgi:putative transposase
MGRKRYSPEQIITKLREEEVLLSQGTQVAEVCRKLGVTEQTYYLQGAQEKFCALPWL